MTQPPWPRRISSCAPLSASQIRAVPSSLAVTTRSPSGLKAALLTALRGRAGSSSWAPLVGVPDPRRPVVARGHHPLAVGAEGGVLDESLVARSNV